MGDRERPTKEYFNEIVRISRFQVIFGGNYFIDLLPFSTNWYIWDKENGFTDFADCEMAWVSKKGAVRKFNYRWQGMLQGNMKEKEKRVHPTQKPLPVMRDIILKYSGLNDIIFDPFLGSGTTAVAAIQTGRRFIGIEIDPGYCEIARKRIAQAKEQQDLFRKPENAVAKQADLI